MGKAREKRRKAWLARQTRDPAEQAKLNEKMAKARAAQAQKKAEREAEAAAVAAYAGAAASKLLADGLQDGDPWPLPAEVEREWRRQSLEKSGHDPFDFMDVLAAGSIKITSKTELGLVPFTPAAMHTPQRMILDVIRRNIARKRKSLIAVFKPRQRAGISTFCMSLAMALWSKRAAWRVKVAAIQKETLEDLWEMYRVAADGLLGRLNLEDDEDAPAARRRPGERANDRFIKHPTLLSRVAIQNALKNLGRGGGWNMGLFSEAEYYPNFWDAYSSVMPGMHDHWSTIGIFESTMKQGADTAYKDFVLAALEGKTFGDKWAQRWEAIFIPWFASENAAVPLTPEQRVEFLGDMTAQERVIMDTHKLAPEQMLWRRKTLHEQFAGKEDLFIEAYPATVDEALRASVAGQYLHDEANQFYRAQVRPPMARYVVNCTASPRMKELTDARDYDLVPHLEVWAPPADKDRYAVICDAASGRKGNEGGENVALVLQIDTGMVCGLWHGRTSIHEFAYAAAQIGAYFNDALLVPENNKDGGLIEVLSIRLAYPRIYRMERFERENWHEDQAVLGFTMSEATRAMAMDSLRMCWNEMRLLVPSRLLFDQVQLTGRRHGQSVSGGQKMRQPDDAAICLAIGCLVRAWSGRWPVRTADQARGHFMEQTQIPVANSLRESVNVWTPETYQRIANRQSQSDALKGILGG